MQLLGRPRSYSDPTERPNSRLLAASVHSNNGVRSQNDSASHSWVAQHAHAPGGPHELASIARPIIYAPAISGQEGAHPHVAIEMSAIVNQGVPQQEGEQIEGEGEQPAANAQHYINLEADGEALLMRRDIPKVPLSTSQKYLLPMSYFGFLIAEAYVLSHTEATKWTKNEATVGQRIAIGGLCLLANVIAATGTYGVYRLMAWSNNRSQNQQAAR